MALCQSRIIIQLDMMLVVHWRGRVNAPNSLRARFASHNRGAG